MNFPRAIGFWVMGWVFERLPRWMPGWFVTSGADGWSTRELWLQLMSWLLVGIAAVYLLRRGAMLAGKWLHYESPAARALVRGAVVAEWVRRPLARPRRIPASLSRPWRGPKIPVILPDPLTEHRRAA